MRAIVLSLLVLATSLGGCTAFDDFISGINRPDHPVARTDLTDVNGNGYVTTRTFQVIVQQDEALEVVIEARGPSIERVTGFSRNDEPVSIDIPDGTWTVTYWVDDYEWETFRNVKVDATPPSLDGLEKSGQANNGVYTIGNGFTPEAGVTVRVEDQLGNVLAQSLPYTLTGLGSGVHGYWVILTDAAGNEAPGLVQVRAGDAKAIPEGDHTFGIVARYQSTAALWDMSDMQAYPSTAQAQNEAAAYLGSGYGITPDDPVVQQVVNDVLAANPDADTTMEIAWVLFQWMFENLEYDDERLDSNTLMLPRDVIQDTESPDDQDANDDGLVDSGSGNGVNGAVCRSLAGTYVSLLRAAGVPARLVSGYLAGVVNGFHAWVEFYGGDMPGQDAWIPVDVSPIDGPFNKNVAMQAFAIQLPEYLPLRQIDASGETAGWSTAQSVAYTYPSHGAPPTLQLAKNVVIEGSEERGFLCFEPDTFNRHMESHYSACNPGEFYVGCDPCNSNDRPFIRFTERLLDYGLNLQSAGPGTEIEVTLNYPFTTDYIVYTDDASGLRYSQIQTDQARGVVEVTIET